MREIKIYNSLTNKIETLKTIKENEVSMYVCGPTVYNDPHIGNMRPVIFFDTFRRFLEYVGYEVKYVSNYTDVDDKIINRAIEENTTEKEITTRYIERYRNCLDALNVEKAYENPKVTEYMPKIIEYIDGLVKNGSAYVNDGEVFFDVLKDEKYGELSKINVDDLIQGARIEENSKKKSSLDFLLWKKTEKGIKWESPWCLGRPGWHTECCVMIDSIFNGMIDIHGGGMDLKFPHHENEIAQAEAMHKHTIANYWMHNAMMNIKGEKMSKSLGNVILAKDAISEYGADTVRLILLNCAYRSILNFTDETIKDAKSIIQKIEFVFKQLNLLLNVEHIDLFGRSEKINKFLDDLSNDVNLPNAITDLLDIIKEANLEIRKKDKNIDILKEDFYALKDMCFILGLHYEPKTLSQEDLELYNNYINAKSAKDFDTSDSLRKTLILKGII